VLLAVLAVKRNSLWAALGGVLLAGLPYLLLRHMVAGYQPSADGDVVADQATGRQALGSYLFLVAVAGLSAVCAVGRRLFGPGRKPSEPDAVADRGGIS
jgi:hypothetical protein